MNVSEAFRGLNGVCIHARMSCYVYTRAARLILINIKYSINRPVQSDYDAKSAIMFHTKFVRSMALGLVGNAYLI